MTVDVELNLIELSKELGRDGSTAAASAAGAAGAADGGDRLAFTSLLDNLLEKCLTAEQLMQSISEETPCLPCLSHVPSTTTTTTTTMTTTTSAAAVAGSSWSSLPVMETESPESVRNRIRTRLCRFIKSEDRYMNLSSLLLKSRLFLRFHEEKRRGRCLMDAAELSLPLPLSSLEPSSLSPPTPSPTTTKTKTTTTSRYPVVDLPRSKHGRPFLPHHETDFPFSISHQFPFAGIAHFPISSDKRDDDDDDRQGQDDDGDGEDGLVPPSLLKLGMDIVVFDPIKPKLYRNEMEFIEVFRESFSAREYGYILSSSDRPREFYLRWAIKEAYTKALGLGMGINFASFELKLRDVTDNSLSGMVGGRGRHEMTHLHGTPVDEDDSDASSRAGVNTRATEVWNVTFVPLISPTTKGGEEEEEEAKSTIVGYACTCVGPFRTMSECNNVRIKWEALRELVDWHVGDDTRKT